MTQRTDQPTPRSDARPRARRSADAAPGRIVSLYCTAPEASAVFLAGSFNGWSDTALAMERGIDGRWLATVQLPPGRHEYKFVVDGCWSCDSSVGNDLVENAFGTMNHMLVVE